MNALLLTISSEPDNDNSHYAAETPANIMGAARGSMQPQPAAFGGTQFFESDRAPLHGPTTNPPMAEYTAAQDTNVNPPFWRQNQRHSRNLVWI